MMSTNRPYSTQTNLWGYSWLILTAVNVVNLIAVVGAIFLSRFGLCELWRTAALGLGLLIAWDNFNRSLEGS